MGLILPPIYLKSYKCIFVFASVTVVVYLLYYLFGYQIVLNALLEKDPVDRPYSGEELDYTVYFPPYVADFGEQDITVVVTNTGDEKITPPVFTIVEKLRPDIVTIELKETSGEYSYNYVDFGPIPPHSSCRAVFSIKVIQTGEEDAARIGRDKSFILDFYFPEEETQPEQLLRKNGPKFNRPKTLGLELMNALLVPPMSSLTLLAIVILAAWITFPIAEQCAAQDCKGASRSNGSVAKLGGTHQTETDPKRKDRSRAALASSLAENPLFKLILVLSVAAFGSLLIIYALYSPWWFIGVAGCIGIVVFVMRSANKSGKEATKGQGGENPLSPSAAHITPMETRFDELLFVDPTEE